MALVDISFTKRDLMVLLSAVETDMEKASRKYLRTQRMAKILASVDPEVDRYNAEMQDYYEMRFNRLHYIRGRIIDALTAMENSEAEEAARCKG